MYEKNCTFAMMKRIFLLFFTIFYIHACFGMPKYEVRAVWLTTLSGLDWPKTKATSKTSMEKQQKELCDILDQLQKDGINTIFLQTRIRGSVLYPSEIEPWDAALTGQYDRNPGYDPLAFAIKECHNRGMELHAWVVTIPAFKTEQAAKMGKRGLLKTHPKLLKKHNGMYYLDPSQEASGAYLERICMEIAGRYDIDGIHFDYIRYPENPDKFPGSKLNRKENITRIVRRINKSVKAFKPWVRFSCSPVGKQGNLSRYSAKGWSADFVSQDAEAWLREGIMDMLCPMMYFQGDHFYPFAADWQEQSCGRTVAPGLGIYFLSPTEKNWNLEVITRELHYLRQLGMGQAFFRTRFLLENVKGLQTWLREQYYTYPALLPPMTWQSAEKPEKPRILYSEKNGTAHSVTLDCDRFVVYSSKTDSVDIENAENLIRVVYGSTFTYDLLTTKLYGINLFFTQIDRYGHESEPVMLRP